MIAFPSKFQSVAQIVYSPLFKSKSNWHGVVGSYKKTISMMLYLHQVMIA
jgi:hypothetical protein